MKKKFAGLIDFRGKRYGYFWISIFILIGVFIYLIAESPGDISVAFLVIVFGVFCFLSILSLDIPLWNFYVIDEKFITFVRLVWKKVPYETIVDIRKIEWKELKKYTDNSWKKMILARYNTNIKGARRLPQNYNPSMIPSTIIASTNYIKLVKWMTAAPSTKVNPVTKKATTAIVQSSYVLITLIDGSQYIISPKDVDGFMKSLPRRLIKK
ncbi:MAG: hypothetical protein Q8N99_02090 [Nanoarchaeota archaeon]|nr:hypothetical protein [Nanoarchaeota archaeon]